MINKPLYLKFKDKAEADIALSNCRYPVEIDVIGIIFNKDVIFDNDGNVITPPTVKDGWHVNLLVPIDCEDYDTYSQDVKTPARIWAL